MRHNIKNNGPKDCGIVPFKREWRFDRPSKDKSEDIIIYGVNSDTQNIYIHIKWRPKSNRTKLIANVMLKFVDKTGDTYCLDQESNVEYNKREYNACGLGVEILCPFRRYRLRFRGYLTRNNRELVFVRFRFLWLGLSRVYDFTTDFDPYSTAKAIVISNRTRDTYLDNRIEQFGQMKGQFSLENEQPMDVYLWGSKSKRYLTDICLNRDIIRIFGYSKQGFGFHISLVYNCQQIVYQMGFLFAISGRFHQLHSSTVQLCHIEQVQARVSWPVKFAAQFGNIQCTFEIIAKQFGANKLLLNGSEGMCFVCSENDPEFHEYIPNVCRLKCNNDSPLVLALNDEDERAQSVTLCGGKGSSLAVLFHMKGSLSTDNNDISFDIPNGVVVTTNAYQLMASELGLESMITGLAESADPLNRCDFQSKCEQFSQLFCRQKLPQIIRNNIENKLSRIFDKFDEKLFAIRSSAAFEDSTQLSAAGQLATILGIKSLDAICEAVMKCWASQFTYQAIEYKRGYGHQMNGPMAVVIQEMVDCESAGVVFTCDPNTGDERVITIAANYGLGESVVMAQTDPDSIKVSINITSNSGSILRTINKIECKQIGAKNKIIKLNTNGGTDEKYMRDSTVCCLTDQDIIRLAQISLQIQTYYGNVRDIEWGQRGGQIFILQSRPLTNLDNNYTDYELMHEMDSPHNSEHEIYSRAHFGENHPGSSSWTALMWRCFSNKCSIFRQAIEHGQVLADDYNPFVPMMGVICNQLMINITNGMAFDIFTEYPNSKMASEIVLAFFGHHIEDKDVLQVFADKRLVRKQPSIISRIKSSLSVIQILFFAPKNMIKTMNEYMGHKKLCLVDQIKHLTCSKDIYNHLMYGEMDVKLFKYHRPVSRGSVLKNYILKRALENAQVNNPYLDYDYNLIKSSCNGVVSVEVPNSLRSIAKSVKDKEMFRQLSDEKALEVLINKSDDTSEQFRQFLKIHGHRGYKEEDPLYLPWAKDPVPCVRAIKSMLLGDESALVPKICKTVEQVMSEIKTPLSFARRLLISRVLIPWSRDGVGYREQSKYFLIWALNKFREAYWHLAYMMTRDGIIPEPEYFFYLTADEIERLCYGEWDPRIITRARHRKRIFPEMDKYKFDEFLKGPAMLPNKFNTNIPKLNDLSYSSVRISGTVVCYGRIEARVCVSEDITDAHNIQTGDILITYSIDIGWSPYFPLLSGIVTEIGGMISHGSVIAREFGLPCLIAATGVCSAFNTGDICVLDTDLAQIIKVE